MASQEIVFDEALIRRYDGTGPRYTSYPTAVQFHQAFGEAEYRAAAGRSGAEGKGAPLSLYVHLPFCATVCFYCACNKIITKNRSRAAPYLEALHREIELQAELFGRERPVEQLHWGGGTPTFVSHDEMRALMGALRRAFRLREDDAGDYSIEVDPREIRPGTLELLRELGFNRLSMGVQDFDPAVQRAVNRIQSEEQTLSVLHAARALGFRSINMDLIYGLPRQTVESFGRTLERVIAAGPDRLSVFNYAHMPALFKTQRQIKAEELPSPAVKLEILRLTIERLTGAGYVYIGMDHFARPDDELAQAQRRGTLHRNFQGYSTHADCDLVGLGITAIGRIGDTYSQNMKTIEAYDAALRAGRLPIFRGVALDADDRLRRRVIMGLICDFALDRRDVEAEYGIDFGEYFRTELGELRTMERDGLIRVTDERLEVLPRGRLLIRNICMVFDRYLREQRTGAYSRVI
ncbi:MAG TPA: oxygen-independent coproporphyrinogen III oxidase [Burkholderiales bacterium]